MPNFGRGLLPYVLAALGLAATAWAFSFGRLPPADFTFNNETEIKSVDPAIVTGSPEGRIVRELFECLVNWHPETLQPMQGVAEDWTISDDLLTHTFYLREDAVWSDGSPVTAEDFHYSYRRLLAPETAAEYAYHLWYVQGAEKYTKSEVEVGDPVEIETTEPVEGDLPFARNEVLYAKLVAIEPGKQIEQDGKKQEDKFDRGYVVQFADGSKRRYRKGDVFSQDHLETHNYKWLLYDFRQVGIKVVDKRTLAFTLKHPVPYFTKLLGFYPLSPVNRKCVETHGYPLWTKPENIVNNGPYLLKERRIRDRIRLAKNPKYWNAKNVSFNVVDALAVDSDVTALNMYETKMVDWIPKVPNTIIQELKNRDDFLNEPYLSVYFYRVNVTKPPLSDPRVRQALNLAVDKQELVDKVARAGQVPATSLVPPGIAGYTPGTCGMRNVEEAKRLLAEAGFPGGKGFPKIVISYNTLESHKSIAELLQSQWKTTLNIDVGLKNSEWAVHQSNMRLLQYDVSRAGWIGDYVDPNTFLELFLTDGENNQTGWGNEEYDTLIKAAQEERDPVQRLLIFGKAETLLMNELPIIPLYYYVASELVRSDIRGFYGNAQDMHPISMMWREGMPAPELPGPPSSAARQSASRANAAKDSVAREAAP